MAGKMPMKPMKGMPMRGTPRDETRKAETSERKRIGPAAYRKVEKAEKAPIKRGRK